MGAVDETKGRLKEAAGDVMDDEELEREGKLDRAAATIKDKFDDVEDWVEDKVDDVKERFDRD